jgi:hypothetical protein
VRADPHATGAGIGSIYAVLYLYALGNIDFVTRTAWGWRTGDLSPDAWFDMRAPLRFEPVAIADVGHFAFLISPMNIVVAGLLGTALALNVHGIVTLIRQPAQCRAGTAGGLAGTLPALLAGGACCAPSLVLVTGIPAISGLAAFSGWLVPLSLVLLLGSRWWQRRQGVPPWFGSRP